MDARTYDVYGLWLLAEPLCVVETAVAQFDTLLDVVCWRRAGAAASDTTPRQTIRAGGTDHREHWERLQAADVTVPILVWAEKNMIVDGMHRLARAVLDQRRTIPVKYLDDSHMAAARVAGA